MNIDIFGQRASLNNKSIKAKDMKLTGIIIRFRLMIENDNINLNEDQYDSQF